MMMATTSSKTNAGFFSSQHDWDVDVKEGTGTFWVCYKLDPDDAWNHGEVNVEGKTLRGGPPFGATLVNKTCFELSYKAFTSSFQAPAVKYRITEDAPYSLDISPEGQLGVSGHDNGSVALWLTKDGSVERRLEGHIGPVNCVKFFPSGQVVLSGGIDRRVKIWSVADGSCPVTLKDHSQAITGLDIIEKGKNILSCSKDGTVRLWDCGTSQNLATLIKHRVPCVGMALGKTPLSQPETERIPHEREVGMDDKILLAAFEDGDCHGIDLRSQEEVLSINIGDSPSQIDFISPTDFVCVTANGALVQYDIRNPSEAVNNCRVSLAPLISLAAWDGHCFCAADDGTVVQASANNGSRKYFTGSEYDPIRGAAVRKSFLYTICKDNFVRKYDLRKK